MLKLLKSSLHNVDWPSVMHVMEKEARDERLKKFYTASQLDNLTTLDMVEFVALDCETTGLNPITDDIVSIGLVPFTLQRIFCRDASYWLVNPRQTLAEESVAIHGITHSDIEDAPDLRKILEEMLCALAGKVVVAHCSDIEREFLNSALVERLGEGIRFPIIDTMAIESNIQHQLNGGLLNRLRGKNPLSVRLPESRQRYGLPPYQLHHALTDAVATAELFQAQVAYHYTPDTALSDLWT